MDSSSESPSDAESECSEEFEGEEFNDEEDNYKTLDVLAQPVKEELHIEYEHEFIAPEDFETGELLKYYKMIKETCGLPLYEDITKMLIDGNVFVVCGDSLILNMMANSNWNAENGGQMLHLIYLCECLLKLFLRKGAAFELVFFDIWKDTWSSNSTVSLARSVLLTHLEKNIPSVRVHCFYAVWDPEFQNYLSSQKPTFLLMYLNLLLVYDQLFSVGNRDFVDLVFHSQLLFSIAFNLPCVDMSNVEVNVSTLHAFFINGRPRLEKGLLRTLDYLQEVLGSCCHEIERKNWKSELDSQHFKTNDDARRIVSVSAAAWYLKNEPDKNSAQHWTRVYLLYSALVEVLPLKHRGCPLPSTKPSKKLMRFISRIQYYMNQAVIHITELSLNFVNISDIWHGNLFVRMLHHLNRLQVCAASSKFGSQTENVYRQLVCHVGEIMKTDFDVFPIAECLLNWYEEFDNTQTDNTELPRHVHENLFPTSCLLTQDFCGDILTEILQQAGEYDNDMNTFITRERSFREIRHWHSNKQLRDECDRIPSREHDFYFAGNKRNLLRYRSKFATFMNYYGSNIEGRCSSSKRIACKTEACVTEKKSGKKVSRKNKVSKREAIIENNIKSKKIKDMKVEEDRCIRFQKTMKDLKSRGNYNVGLREAKTFLKCVHSPESIQQALVYNAEFYYLLWREECWNNSNPLQRDITLVKELFLTLRTILQNSEKNNIALTDALARDIGSWLCMIGFKEIAQHRNLPIPEKHDRTFEVGISWVKFQMLHLGPDLERLSEEIRDGRVDFIPDPWQRRVFDCIDKRQSAVIVAPTSSGKTYASYYCMESVLREDNEGVVVYVAPTKALVNQVAATVYARFKGKTMPVGKSVYGVFTRDYRSNELNCQILITVPQCLELLLLSPRRFAWIQKLRYVIFDEIHCLAGQAGGISWECGLLLIRCPFLALSATVERPEVLHDWLQDAESFKFKRDRLDGCERPHSSYRVHLEVHQERHNDLRKYVYGEDRTFHPIHPYAYIDKTVIKEHSGIPSHVSLSPKETLELYLSMKSVAPRNEGIIQLNPESYFQNTDFIIRSELRKYESDLKGVLEDWASIDETAYESVRKLLNSYVAESDECSLPEHFLHLIQDLQKENLFPAIIFKYDKHIIDSLLHEFVTHCEKFQRDFSSERKQIKSHDVCNKKGKHMENQNSQLMNKKTLDLLEVESTASIRNLGVVDKNDVKLIERRLISSGYKRSDVFPTGLRNGMGKHHGAMNSKERSSVKMLFRMRVLNVALATGTLALGIHMPCKTVVIAGESPFLNTLEFHQISGRAGRRGFDTFGNVIFYGISERKVKTLLTGKMPVMLGNFPLTVSLVLRLLLLVSDATCTESRNEMATRDALSRALTFLNCSLAYQSMPELKTQMKHFFAYSTQLLILQGLLDDQGSPQELAGLVVHLHYHEPGNLAFVNLLHCGAIQRLCQLNEDGTVSKEAELNLVLVLSYLFARQPLHATHVLKKYNNSKVKLPPLPDDVLNEVEKYNREVKYIYNHYFQCVARHFSNTEGEDNKLPLSKVCISPSNTFNPDHADANLETLMARENVPRKICSSFAALSGHTDRNLYSHNDAISNIRHQVFTDIKVIPVLDHTLTLNSYALDFYKHGISTAIIEDNGIRECYNRLNDFRLALLTIYTSLTELITDEKDPLVRTFRKVTNNFGSSFHKAFLQGHYRIL